MDSERSEMAETMRQRAPRQHDQCPTREGEEPYAQEATPTRGKSDAASVLVDLV